MKKFFTSESVTEGHPDKVCDNISDGILDAIFALDPMARAAVDCAAAYDTLLIMGEVSTTAKVDYEATARAIIKRIGYDLSPNLTLCATTDYVCYFANIYTLSL